MKIIWKKWKLPAWFHLEEKPRKILATALVALFVTLFFVWLGYGLYAFASEEKRETLTPFYILYAVFPALTLLFSGIRLYRILTKEEQLEETPKETEEPVEEMQ